MGIRDIRRIYSIRQILGMGDKKKIVCPLPTHAHHNNTPSFSVFTGPDNAELFHCFGNCGLFGDVIDFIGYMNISDYNDKDPEKVRQAANMLQGDFEICIPEPMKQKLPPRPNIWMDYYPPKKRGNEYARKRGLTDREIEKFKLGQYETFMAIPSFEYNTLKGIKFRNTVKSDLRFFTLEGTVHSLFNHDAVAYSTEPIVVVKGEIPVMVLDRFGILACAPSSGESSSVAPYKEKLILSKKIIVIGDWDKKENVREQIIPKTIERAEILGAELYFPPEPYDIDEWVLSNPDEVIPTIKGWLA